MSENSPHLTSDQLVDLAHGLMSEDDAVAALAHVHDCAQCESDLREISRLQEVLRAAPVPGAPRQVRVSRSPSRIVWSGAALAMAAVLATMMFWPRADPTSDAYWLPYAVDTSTLRSLEPSGSADYDAGLQAYAKRDAERARRLLEQSPVPESLSAERALYLASAQHITGDCSACLKTLASIEIAYLPQPARRQAQWIRYVCLRETGQSHEANELLDALVREPGDIGERARREAARLSGQNR